MLLQKMPKQLSITHNQVLRMWANWLLIQQEPISCALQTMMWMQAGWVLFACAKTDKTFYFVSFNANWLLTT